jgi:RHS repeat-associated protein
MKTEGRTYRRFSKIVVIALGDGNRAYATSKSIPLCASATLRETIFYAYDPIGNRISATEYDHEDNALVSSYTANELNQYEQRTVPGYAGVRGSATNTATVTVNRNPAWRLSDYFYGGDAADNSGFAIMKELETLAVINPPGTNTPDIVQAETGRIFIPETPESFTHDDDGNLTKDGRFVYTWDGENRLIAVETRADLPESVPRVRVEYQYDHRSRRISKTVHHPLPATHSYIYDGWNLIAEATGSNTTHYVWGLDLSGSLQGAGGVGGLVAVAKDAATYHPAFDGNGNVCEYTDASGTIVAHYEYSPFGETVIKTGSQTDSFAFRFSSKYWENEANLYYYGYRFYVPATGRWLNRDPIEENGGTGLYCAVRNSLVLSFDLNGLLDVSLENYVKRDFTTDIGGAVIAGVGFKINATRESALHCCKGGKYDRMKREIVEWNFGVSGYAQFGFATTVTIAGVGVDIGFKGPRATFKPANITSTIDNCVENQGPVVLTLINVQINPGIENVTVGLGNLASVKGSMSVWFDFQLQANLSSEPDYRGGIYLDYDIGIIGVLGFREYRLLDMTSLVNGSPTRMPLLEF